jgi:hypothetical protein
MAKRMAAAFLWYGMVWVGYEIAWSVVGIPRSLGPILAASVAMFITVDPLRLFWPRPEDPGPASVEATVPALDRSAVNSN